MQSKVELPEVGPIVTFLPLATSIFSITDAVVTRCDSQYFPQTNAPMNVRRSAGFGAQRSFRLLLPTASPDQQVRPARPNVTTNGAIDQERHKEHNNIKLLHSIGRLCAETAEHKTPVK